jgi:hypothetical protein
MCVIALFNVKYAFSLAAIMNLNNKVLSITNK